MITNIEISKIYPHPKNPRLDLGDLEELAESIKKNGIMQNLIVVPYLGEVTGEPLENMYRVIVGHRRLAAAKEAGLMEAPCVISDMDEKQQIATMLLENLLREDLTVMEQVNGIQMMLDLGESVKDIAEQTGFSEATIYRRAKLLELDQEQLRESMNRGATLMDYAELDKIKDLELRNSVLKSIGTNNFSYRLQDAIRTEEWNARVMAIVDELKEYAEETDDTSDLVHVRVFYRWGNENEFEKPEDAGERKYYYMVDGEFVRLLAEKVDAGDSDETEDDETEKREREERVERCSRLGEINKTAYELRREFVKNYPGYKKHGRDIMLFAANCFLDEEHTDIDEVCNMYGVDFEEDDEDDLDPYEVAREKFLENQERALLVTAYCAKEWSSSSYHNWNGAFVKNENLDAIYDILIKCGYQMSDDEYAYRDGTHELYYLEEE